MGLGRVSKLSQKKLLDDVDEIFQKGEVRVQFSVFMKFSRRVNGGVRVQNGCVFEFRLGCLVLVRWSRLW